MEKIYILGGRHDYLAYEFIDRELFNFIRRSGRTRFPKKEITPIHLAASFGDAPKQPTKAGDFHTFDGNGRIFSSRAVEVLNLHETGRLYECKLEGREDKFYWYWCNIILDCLDKEKSTYMRSGSLNAPKFLADKIGSKDIFTIPEDQEFQSHLFVTEEFKNKIKISKITGFTLSKELFDSRPWRSG